MHVSSLHLRVHAGTAPDVVEYYREHGILDMAGCLWSHLAIDDDDPDAVLVITGWRDVADLREWYADPRRAATVPGLSRWITAESDVHSHTYAVALSSATADSAGRPE